MSESEAVRLRANGRSSNPVDQLVVPPEEEEVQHSGIRGGKSCCLCLLVTVLVIVAIANALMTAGLLYFLSITHEGMASVEFFIGEKHIRVLSNIHVDSLVLQEDLVSRRGKEIIMEGDELTIGQINGAKILLEGNSTVLSADHVDLKSLEGKLLYSTSTPLNLDLYQVNNLHAAAIDVGSVQSRQQFPDLHIESYHGLDIVGTEGVDVTSEGNVELQTGEQVVIGEHSENIVFESDEGVYLSQNLPLDGKGPDFASDTPQYKLCVCAGSGRLFAVADSGADTGCHSVDTANHPCLAA